jgi:hypothetical protein
MDMVDPNKENIVRRAWIWGVSGALTLLATYFLTLTLSNSLLHAFEELKVIGVWIAILAAGFGIQTGLFVYARRSLKVKATTQAAASMAASGGVSATAMVACCMHHLAEFLPILGVSAASLFLIKYQTFFLAVGVASNLVGITVMLRLIQKQELYEAGHGVLGRLLKPDMNIVLALNTTLGIITAGIILIRTL